MSPMCCMSTEIEILPRRNQQANMVERVAVVAKLSEEADLMKACRMIMEKVCGILGFFASFSFVILQIVGDAKINENMSNFNLVEQRRGKRLNCAGDDMHRTPMGMGMSFGGPPSCMGPYSASLGALVRTLSFGQRE